MKKKRIISALLVSVLLAGLLSLTALAAQPELQLELKVVGQPQVGQEITVELWCTENPGLASFQLTLAYNNRVLDCTKCSAGTALQGMLTQSNPNGDQGAVVIAASAENVNQNGLIARYGFNVLGEGDCDFALQNVVILSEKGAQIPVLVSGLNQSVGGSSENAGGSEPPVLIDPQPGRPWFTDIAGHWAEEYLNLSYERDLMAGYPNGTCQPDANVTRAEFVMVLYKNAGWPAVSGPSTFEDLEPGAYYLNAVAWAQQTGLVAGKEANRIFAPNDYITREEVAVILRKMSGNMTGSPFANIYDQSFYDADQMSSWGRDPVYWAIYNNVWCGSGKVAIGDRLEASEPATRAEIAVMMINYQDNAEGGL